MPRARSRNAEPDDDGPFRAARVGIVPGGEARKHCRAELRAGDEADDRHEQLHRLNKSLAFVAADMALGQPA